MKVSQNWLKNLVEITSTPEDLSEKLSIGGFEVESLEDCSENVNGVVLGKVLSVLKHEGSDKLSICQVDIGTSKNLQIICGASNIKPNIFVYVATVGAKLNAVDLTIKKSEIRGVMSEGMICSLQELGLEDSSEGIEIIDEDLALKHELGTPGSELLQLNDFIYDLAITANRPDGMSVIGIAREISALLESTLNFPELNHKYNIHLLKGIKLCPEAIESNCIYTISCIDCVNGEKLSPNWLKDRIEKSGIKSINLLVDLTNYILLEQGQPLHAFDKDKLSNLIGKEVSPEDFSVRKGKDNESLICLDGKEYDLNDNITVITCCDKPVAIAGVIGGLETSVTNTTSSIYLEGAVFNPVTIRKSSKAVGIRTESSSRYEKGISSKNTISAVTRAINLLEEYFSINLPIINTSNLISNEDIFIKLRRNRIHKILGPLIINDQFEKRNLSDNEIVDKLTLIGCTLKNKEYGWDVAVIPNRSHDLIREIDLIEEIARLIGYDNFDSNMPDPLEPGVLTPANLVERRLRNSFIHNGFQEVVTSSLVGPDNTDGNAVIIKNPLLSETSRLRTNVWDEHLKILQRNVSFGAEGCWIFEIAKTYKKDKESFVETNLLAGALTGNKLFSKWGSASKQISLDYFEARGKLKQSLEVLGIETIDKQLIEKDFMHPGRTSELFVEGKSIGFFGQIHPSLSEKYDLIKETYLFNLEFDALIKAATRKTNWTRIYKDYPTVPYMERDIALIHSKKYSSLEIINLIKKSGRPLLEKVELIDRYEGSSIPEDSISQAFRIKYRDPKKTLIEEDINPIHEKIRTALKEKLNADLRS